MMDAPFRERPEFLRGRTGERVVATWLQQRGWYVIPSYDYSGEDGNKAPRLEGKAAGFVIPDLDIARNGERRWAEVKAKTEATYYRKGDRLEHGISARHHDEYLRVQAISGCHVWLFIVEENTQVLLAESLDRLGQGRHYGGWKMGRGGMVFWPRSSFGMRVNLGLVPSLLTPEMAKCR